MARERWAPGRRAAALPPATGTPGVWENVTSPEMPASLFTGSSGFGVGNIRVDPARPSDLYVGGYGSIWKSTDYGKTWTRLDSMPNPPYLALGHVLAVGGTTPATLWMANVAGDDKVFKSTDGGLTFTLTGTLPEKYDSSFYSIVVDPHDTTHLITGFHEADKMAESTDGGETWKFTSGAGWPAGGVSWFPFFVETGDAGDDAQDLVRHRAERRLGHHDQRRRRDVDAAEGHRGPQSRPRLLAALPDRADAVHRRRRRGHGQRHLPQHRPRRELDARHRRQRLRRVGNAEDGLRHVGLGVRELRPQRGRPAIPDRAAAGRHGRLDEGPTLPDGLVWGPNSVAVTSDGTHSVFVGSMWATGLWRYVEP